MLRTLSGVNIGGGAAWSSATLSPARRANQRSKSAILLTAKPREGIEEVNLEETLLSKYAESGEATFDKKASNLLSNVGNGEYDGAKEIEWIRIIQANNEKKTEFVWIGRNDVCPCWSGKKFKQCHGK